MDYFDLRHYDRTMKKLILLVSFALVACAKPPSSTLSQNENFFGIYGGEKVTDQQPFGQSIVAIIDTNLGGICTGTIIANDLILTAAHCVHGDGSSLEIYFEKMVEPYGSKTTRVLKAVPHEDFKRNLLFGNWHDIALLKFDPKDLPANYKPMRVMTNAHILRDGSGIIGAGYGVKDPKAESGSGVLRWLLTSILDVSLTDTEMSIDQNFEKGLCFGDSGGPTMIRNKQGEYLLVGVTSRVLGYEFQKCAIRSVVTRVDVYLPWIRKQAKTLRNQN